MPRRPVSPTRCNSFLGDLFETDFSKASVLTLYLLPQINMALRKQILDLTPGTRVVSHAFDFEDWEPDAAEQHEFRKVFYWVVPAKVAGWWSGQIDGKELEIELRQQFQQISGVSRVGETRAAIQSGRLAGDMVTMTITLPDGKQRILGGRLEGGVMVGEGWSLKRP